MNDIVGCPRGRFRCKTKYGLRCLSNSWKCDWKNDCQDGIDEADCGRCNPGLFECKAFDPPYKKCLDISWRCDGHEDCDLGDDEDGCNYTTKKEPQIITSKLTATVQKIPRSTATPSTTKTITTITIPLTTTESTTKPTPSPTQPTTTKQTTTPLSTNPSTTTPSTSTTKFPSTTPSQTITKQVTTTEPHTELANSSITETNSIFYNETNEQPYHRGPQSSQRSVKTDLDGHFDTGSNGTYVKSVQALDQIPLPYFVYGSLAFVIIVLTVVVAICFCKNRQKKKRRLGRLPPIPSQGSPPGTTINLSATSRSYSTTTDDYPDSHEYEDIEKYRHPVMILAQTSTHSWDTDSTKNNGGNNRYNETDWGDINIHRNSSYAAVLQFSNGHPSTLTSFYEQPQKCQEELELHNEYLSIQEVTVTESTCPGQDENVNKTTDKGNKRKGSDFDNHHENKYYLIQDECVSESVCSEYEESACMISDKKGKDKMPIFNSIHDLSVTESFSNAYEEPVRTASYKRDTCENYENNHVSTPLVLQSKQCSISLKSAQSDESVDYLKPISDDYIHPL